jgi:nucleoside-diphosphate-sugar epimerase
MADQRTASDGDFAVALASLRDACERAVAAIQGDSHAQHAFESATALADTLRQLAESAASLRARTAARIATEEKLSLSVLATRIGVSKARADQLLKSVKDSNPGTERSGGNTGA